MKCIFSFLGGALFALAMIFLFSGKPESCLEYFAAMAACLLWAKYGTAATQSPDQQKGKV